MLISSLLALHLLGIVLWVGGMIFALFVLRPSLAVLAPPDRLSLHTQVLTRFFRLVRIAVPVVLLSGYAMLFGVYGSFAHAPWPIHVMHLTGLIMTGIFIAILAGPWRAIRRGETPQPAQFDRIRRLVHINFGLGVLTIIVAALL